ncbi:MAG: hypothetical protein ER33_04685 [Cyanobium sp. CACIAM 14]|nr:MAG: hypothetical protein ER33_04685 [Cyanobium sp. CACIAM 14]
MFSSTFRYAVISLLEIAGAKEGVNTAAIAERHNIPGTYLASVLSDLRRLGLILSQKGRRGGYLLAKPPEEINLLALQQGLAGSSEPLAGTGQAVTGAEIWLQTVEDRWRQELGTTTLGDVQRFVAQAVSRSAGPVR